VGRKLPRFEILPYLHLSAGNNIVINDKKYGERSDAGAHMHISDPGCQTKIDGHRHFYDLASPAPAQDSTCA
jgi:hypothetical protein